MKYRKKPSEVDAVQWTGDNLADVIDFMHYEDEQQDLVSVPVRVGGDDQPNGEIEFYCLKSQRDVVLEQNGWIIAESDGEGFYPCTSEQFAGTYDATAASPQKRLVLRVEIPDFWADDLDELAGYCSEPDPPGPEDRLYVVTEEWMRADVGITLVSVPGDKCMSNEFEVHSYLGRIVGAEAVPISGEAT